MSKTFDKDAFQGFLSTSDIGRKLIYTDVTGSTMDDARKLGHNVIEYPHGTVVMSEVQMNARGARNHKWDASNTGNIYASIILHLPPIYKTHLGVLDLEAAACLAALQAVHKYGVTEAITKWPNDMWVRGHKIAGFLVEDGRMDIPGTLNCLIILGLGINTNADIRCNPDLHTIATSMFCERGGNPVSREEFFADVCAALEHFLSQKREDNLVIFRRENLFQENCDISVTSPSEGKVIEGKFVEICDNWDIKFIDTQSGETLQGSCDYYTVRPKVVDKILVVFTGVQINQSASNLSRWLMSVVDTSKHVVCLVPEASITGSDRWMKTCSLLVLAEQMCDTDAMSSKVRAFLRSGGHVMAAGMGSLFLAKVLHVPLKEVLLESSQVNSEVGLVHLQVEFQASKPPSGAKNGQLSLSSPEPQGLPHATNSSDAGCSGESSSTSECLIFPTSPVCFQFFEDEKALLSESTISGSDSDNEKERWSSRGGGVASGEKEIDAEKINSVGNAQVKAFYLNAEDGSKTIAIFTSQFPGGGCIALWGFDVGVMYPLKQDSIGSQGAAADEFKAVDTDKFKRDKLLQDVLKILIQN